MFLLLDVRVNTVFAFKMIMKLCVGADVNIEDINDETALHCAAEKGWVHIAKFLVYHSANVNARDKVRNLL